MVLACGTRFAAAAPEPSPPPTTPAKSAPSEPAPAPSEPAPSEPAPSEPAAPAGESAPSASEAAPSEPAAPEPAAPSTPTDSDDGADGIALDPAPAEASGSQLEAPPTAPAPQAASPASVTTASDPLPLPPALAPAPSRGPLGLSGPALRTLGWITLAVSAAAGVGLTTAGIVACNGEGLDCIQGQPLIWSGAVVGLGGIPIGLTLIVRGGQLSVESPALATRPFGAM